MRRSVAFAAAAALALTATAQAADASAKPADRAAPKTKLRILTPRQDSILSRGLRVRVVVRGKTASGSKRLLDPRRGRLRASSASFDDAGFSPISRTRKLRVRRAGRRVVALKLTDAAEEAISSCAARTIRVRMRGRTDVARLGRSGSCGPQPVDLSRADDCDFIGQQEGSLCLLPFPDDYYTVADPSSATGRRVDLHAAAMPDNAAGKPIDPAPYRLNDGFSPGQTILLRVPGLDSPAALAATDPVPINHIGRYAEPDAPVVVIDAETGERLADLGRDRLQRHQPRRAPRSRSTRRATSSRGIATSSRCATCARADGGVIAAPEGFRYYRDDLPLRRAERSTVAALTSRRSSSTLRDAGHPPLGPLPGLGLHGRQRREHRRRAPCTCATTPSAPRRQRDGRRRRQRILARRSRSPGHELHPAQDPQIARRDHRHLRGALLPGARLRARRHLRRSTATACRRATATTRRTSTASSRSVAVGRPGPEPARPSIYGHGLFGGAGEVYGSPVNRDLADQLRLRALRHRRDRDVGRATSRTRSANILTDLSNFPELADRLQQGLLNELFLSRLMIHPDGFASAPAFHADGTLGTAVGDRHRARTTTSAPARAGSWAGR